MTMRCHLPPVKMVVFKKTTNKPWQRFVVKRETLCIVGGDVNWCIYYGKEDWEILPLSIYPKKMKTLTWFKHLKFTAALFAIAKTWKFIIDGWIHMENMVYIHTYNRILFYHKKEGNHAICNNMDGLWGHYV